MGTRHLDHDSYQRLRSGRLDPAEARELARHLEEECDVCEAFLAARPLDDLDGVVDRALAGLAPPSAEARPSEGEFARIRAATSGRARGTARMGRWVAAAAAVLMVGGVSLLVARSRSGQEADSSAGVKGRQLSPVPARLRFAVVGGEGGTLQLDRGRDGAVVPAGASLAFRIELGRPAYLAVLRIGGGEREVVWKRRVDRAGVVDVSEGGRPAAYPLKGLSGVQRFALVASEAPITADDLAAAARVATGAGAASGDARWSVMTLDVVEVTVR